MIRTNLCVALFLFFAFSISIPSSASAEYLEEIKDDPVQSLFSEALLQSHLNEKVSFQVYPLFHILSYDYTINRPNFFNSISFYMKF